MLDGYSLRKYGWKDWLFMILTSSLVLQIILTFILSPIVVSNADEITNELIVQISVYGTIFGTIASLPLTLLVVYWLKIPLFNRRQLSKDDSFIVRGLTKADWKFLAKYIPLSYILYRIGDSIVAYFFGATVPANQAAVESLFGYIPVWVLFIMMVVVAPIVEELLFRGVMLFPGHRLNTTWVRTIVSAVLFGLIHAPTDIYSAYTYIGMGFIFAYASKRTQSIEAAMVYHFLNNLVGFIAILYYL